MCRNEIVSVAPDVKARGTVDMILAESSKHKRQDAEIKELEKINRFGSNVVFAKDFKPAVVAKVPLVSEPPAGLPLLAPPNPNPPALIPRPPQPAAPIMA